MLKRLFSKTSTPTEVAAALSGARTDLVAAEAAVEAAQARYDAGLLTLERSALRELQDAKADAQTDADHARAVVARFEVELERATNAEAEANRRAAYDNARELSDTARKRLADYDKAARKIRDVLGAIAAADVAVLACNQDLPEGAAPLSRPEDVRSTPTLYREEISDEIVELWAAENSQSSPINPHLQRQVQEESRFRKVGSRYDDDPTPVEEITGRGTVRVDSGSYLNVVKLRFVKRTFLPDQGGRHIANLAAEVNLPPLYAGAGPFWEADNGRASDVLDRLSKPIPPRPAEQERTSEIEYQLVRNT